MRWLIEYGINRTVYFNMNDDMQRKKEGIPYEELFGRCKQTVPHTSGGR